ncbi:MAG: hypothetical protein ACK4ME_10690 [Fimbriimonadales bacterium]
MNTIRLWAMIVGIVCLLTWQPTAQQAQPKHAQQVLDRMAQAMGYAQAAQFRTIQVVGTMEYPAQGLKGQFEAFYKSPDKFLMKINIQGIGEILQGYDGKVGWEKNPMTGLRELQGAELQQLRQSALSGANNDIRKMVRNAKLQNQEKVGGRNAFVITAQSATGGAMKLYIDAQRYLLLRIDSEVATPQGKMNATMLFEDYRKVDGVIYAFTTRQSAAGMTTLIKIVRVRHNAPVNDAIFRKPTN